MTKAARVRRKCEDRLHQLRLLGFEVPRPFDGHELCRRVSRCIDRQITLVGIDMPTGAPYGVTFFTDAGSIIAYERRTTPVHRDHIVAHEVAHVVFDHDTVVLDDQDAAQLLMPSLRPQMVNRVLNRNGAYDRDAEHEAEMMATILLEEASRGGDVQPTIPHQRDPRDEQLYARLRHAFEHPDR